MGFSLGPSYFLASCDMLPITFLFKLSIGRKSSIGLLYNLLGSQRVHGPGYSFQGLSLGLCLQPASSRDEVMSPQDKKQQQKRHTKQQQKHTEQNKLATNYYMQVRPSDSLSLSCNAAHCVSRHSPKPTCIVLWELKMREPTQPCRQPGCCFSCEPQSLSSLTQESCIFCQHLENSGRLTCLFASKANTVISFPVLAIPLYTL